MKLIIVLIAFFVFTTSNVALACNNSTISIVSQTTNADGSITYTLDLCVELGGLDAVFYGFALEFQSASNTPNVILGGAYPTTQTITNGMLSTGSLSGTLQGLTGAAINSVVNDSDWNSLDNKTNVLSFESSELFGATSDDICMQIQVTVMGCAENIRFYSSVNSGANSCIFDASTGVNCATCNISALAATPGACNNNTYSVSIIVTYSNAPGSGTLNVLGQTFAITSSPQTLVVPGLTADGQPVNVTALFSADPTCTITTNSLYTAPAACITCNANAGTFN